MTTPLEETSFTPPYMSFETFRNFVQRLNPQAMPPRIDRSMMIGMAGGTQTALMQLLRQFDLIGDSNEVRGSLMRMSQGDETFIEGLREILRTFYAAQLEIGRQQGTPAQLAESFHASGYTGSTLRKAITFFLHAAKAAELPLSPHFRPPKASPSTSRAKRPRPSKAQQPQVESAAQASAPAAESHTIELLSGGTITVSCTASFLALTKDDRDFLFGLVDQLKDYASQHGTLASDSAKDHDGSD